MSLEEKPYYVTNGESEKERFERIHRIIIEQKLFLDPLFSRRRYMKLCLVNKNRLAGFLREYTGMNFKNYINSLRLDYAAKLLLKYPGAPVKAVASDSGFNNIRTFYRAFESKYGVTPSKYRKS